jgi:hypothetical protein
VRGIDGDRIACLCVSHPRQLHDRAPRGVENGLLDRLGVTRHGVAIAGDNSDLSYRRHGDLFCAETADPAVRPCYGEVTNGVVPRGSSDDTANLFSEQAPVTEGADPGMSVSTHLKDGS